MPRRQRFVLLAVAVVILVVAVVVIGGGGDDDKTDSGAQTIKVVGGKPEGGVKKLTYAKGDPVDLTIESDTADEVHIHGYDLMEDVEQGGSVHFTFKASLDGSFEIELEDAKQQLADLVVEP